MLSYQDNSSSISSQSNYTNSDDTNSNKFSFACSTKGSNQNEEDNHQKEKIDKIERYL